MSGIARAVAAKLPHHIVQGSNNREKIFFSDKEKYMSLLMKYADICNSQILDKCLKNSHVHLPTRSKKEDSLYKMIQGVTLCYTQHINRKYKRTVRPFDSEGFMKKTEKKLDRRFILKPPWRVK